MTWRSRWAPGRRFSLHPVGVEPGVGQQHQADRVVVDVSGNVTVSSRRAD